MDERLIRERLALRRALVNEICNDETLIRNLKLIVPVCGMAIRHGNRIFTCGNGGSMSCATHLAEELTGRYKANRQPYPAVAIAEAAHLTCVANDYGFSEIFARYIEAWGQAGDVLIIFSTSGNSRNLVRAAVQAEKQGMIRIGFLGKDDGAVAPYLGYAVHIPSTDSALIQEWHTACLHLLVEGIEPWQEIKGGHDAKD